MYRPSSGEEQDVEARRDNKQLGQRNRLKASGCSWKHVWGREPERNESLVQINVNKVHLKKSYKIVKLRTSAVTRKTLLFSAT